MTSLPTLKTVCQTRFLVIGYGNELRGDDAAGPYVASAVADWRLPSVKAMALPQLTPELVNDLVATDYAIFIDACGHHTCAPTVQLEPIVGPEAPKWIPAMTHSCNPWSLLTLTQRLYGRMPQAWLLQIPTENFELGDSLSSTAQRGCDLAKRTIEQLLQTYQQPAYGSDAKDAQALYA